VLAIGPNEVPLTAWLPWNKWCEAGQTLAFGVLCRRPCEKTNRKKASGNRDNQGSTFLEI